jgi:hypothetical protein
MICEEKRDTMKSRQQTYNKHGIDLVVEVAVRQDFNSRHSSAVPQCPCTCMVSRRRLAIRLERDTSCDALQVTWHRI